MFKKITVIPAILFIVISFFTVAWAKQSPEELLMMLPNQIKNFAAEDKVVKYKEEAYGASRGYNDSAAAIAMTIFIYDLGSQNIPNGVDSKIIRRAKDDAMAEIKETEKLGVYSNVKLGKDMPVDFDLGGGRMLKSLFASYTFQMPEISNVTQYSSVVSDMYLLGLKGYICKIRVSRSRLTGEKEKEIQEAIRFILLILSGDEKP